MKADPSTVSWLEHKIETTQSNKAANLRHYFKTSGIDVQAFCAEALRDYETFQEVAEAFLLDDAFTRKATAVSLSRGEVVMLSAAMSQADESGTRTIQVLRAGSFVDMHGTAVEVDSAALDAYVANSNALLLAERVPVELGHPDRSDAPAAAWYKRFFKQVVDGVEWVCAEIELSALGAQSLSDKLYKYFSANLDLAGKTVCGGGFVNRPAVPGQQPLARG